MRCAAPNSGREPDGPLPHRNARIHLSWLIGPCVACDFLMVPLLSSINGPPRALHIATALGVVGCVLAQGNLLAAWLAWSEGPFLQRLIRHWIIAAGLYLVWLVGLAMGAKRDAEMPQVAATVALVVPLVSVGAQFPLWLARQWFGWRLVQDEAGTAGAATPSEPPLSIRDLMVATLVVATSLALARLAPGDGKEAGVLWLIAFVAASLISSVALLPAGALLMRLEPFGRGLASSAVYAAAWIALPWLIVAGVRASGIASLPPRVLFVGLSSLMITFAVTLMLAATIARDRGYRLAGRRKPSIVDGGHLTP